MKPKHIKLLEVAWEDTAKVCDHDVGDQSTGTMCACAFLLSAIRQLKKGYKWE